MRRARSFQLTAELVAAHSGGPVVALDPSAIGRTYRLHASRPGPELNERITRDGVRGDVIGSDGQLLDVEPAGSAVTRVDIRGAIEQRAGYHDICAGWSDGHDAIAERMISALEQGDVVLVIDSPGGAVAGLQEAVRQVLAAKIEHGRTVYAFADECVASAAYWWAAAVADEIYLPEAGYVGSIGTRSCHVSMAGALAQDGVVVTHFAWPGEGKVAFAPELPLSEIGKERGARDVAIAGEAFAAAVAMGRPQLTRDAIVALAADCLAGQAAVDAGLADGVATLDAVMNMALTERENDMPAPQDDKANDEEDPKEDTEGEEDPKDEAKAEDEPEEEDEEEDEEEPAAAKARTRAPRSLAALAGLADGASIPAIKSALVPLVGLARHVMKLTETSSPSDARGALDALAADAAAAGKLRTELGTVRRKANAQERMDLLRKLDAAGVHTHGELFVHAVDPTTGVETIKPAPLWSSGSEGRTLANLRGYVQTKLKNAPSTKAAPFEPDPTKLRQPGAVVTELDRSIAAKHGHDPAKVAAARQALFSNNGASRGV